jgi:membrane-anchored protein YejM (alkaline phosphatase superfamily)
MTSAVVLPLLIYFLTQAPKPMSGRQWLYVIGTPGYYLTTILLVPVFLSPLALSKLTCRLHTLVTWALVLYLGVDAIVFNSYAYHLQPTILRLIFFDFGGLGVPVPLLVVFGLTAVASVGGLTVLARFLERRRLGCRLLGIYVGALVLSLILLSVSSLIHVWADANSREDILIYNGYLPLYRPLTSHNLISAMADNFPAIFPAVGASERSFRQDYSVLVKYPLEEIRFTPPPRSVARGLDRTGELAPGGA